MPCVGLMGGFNVQRNKCVWPEKLQLLQARQRTKKRLRGNNSRITSVDALVLMGTHRKAAEDVRSCSHADANHAVDPAEKPPVTNGDE